MSPHGSSVDASVCESHFRCDELCTVSRVSTLFLAPERAAQCEQKTTCLKMKLMCGCGPLELCSGIQTQKFHVCLCRGFFKIAVARRLFLALSNRVFFQQVQMGSLDGSSLGIHHRRMKCRPFRASCVGCGEAG